MLSRCNSTNWFKKHLNLTLTFVAIFTYLLTMVGFAPTETTEQSRSVVGMLMQWVNPTISNEAASWFYLPIWLVLMLPVEWWVLSKKNRSLWYLLWGITPFGWIILLYSQSETEVEVFMRSWEQKLAAYQSWKIIPDIIRWVLILGILGFVFYRIFTADVWGAIIWAILWIPIGLILLMNVIGFLTLPLYMLLGLIFKINLKDVVEETSKDEKHPPRVREYLGAGRTGNSKTHIFHHPDCYQARQTSHENAIWFERSEDAITRGYKPCTICKPELPYRVLNTGRRAYLLNNIKSGVRVKMSNRRLFFIALFFGVVLTVIWSIILWFMTYGIGTAVVNIAFVIITALVIIIPSLRFFLCYMHPFWAVGLSLFIWLFIVVLIRTLF